MKKNRDIWLDASRGIAIVVTMYVHFMRWFSEGFANWDFTMGDFSSFDVAWVRLIEGYLRICWVGPFVFAFFINKKAMDWDLKWYFKRFLLLFVMPSVVWMMYSQSFELRFEIIQALFVFTILCGILIETPVILRLIFYSIVIFLCFYLHPIRDDLASQSLIWKVLVGSPKQLNYFPLLYGLPSFFWFFELYNIYHRKTDKDIKYIAYSVVVALIAIAGLYFIGAPMIPNHYPANAIEYFSSFAFTSMMHLLFFLNRKKVNPHGVLTLIGRYTWLHFMGHLIIGGLVFEVGGLFLNNFSFLWANVITILIILTLWKINLIYARRKNE